jgi:hypothetical protein
VPKRDLEIEQCRPMHPDLDHVDDVVRTLERRRPIEMRRDRGRSTEGAVRPTSDRLGSLEALGVDVVQRDLCVRQFREGEDVPQEVLRELDAAGTDEGDLGAHWAGVILSHRV